MRAPQRIVGSCLGSTQIVGDGKAVQHIDSQAGEGTTSPVSLCGVRLRDVAVGQLMWRFAAPVERMIDGHGTSQPLSAADRPSLDSGQSGHAPAGSAGPSCGHRPIDATSASASSPGAKHPATTRPAMPGTGPAISTAPADRRRFTRARCQIRLQHQELRKARAWNTARERTRAPACPREKGRGTFAYKNARHESRRAKMAEFPATVPLHHVISENRRPKFFPQIPRRK